MNPIKNFIFCGSSIVFFALLSSCNDKCETTYTYKSYEPVYMTLSTIRDDVSVRMPEVIDAPGKIYLYDHYLFVNEVSKGIHVIDNTDPSSPVNKSFINIPGNFDMAVKDNILYADSYVDLLVFDISDPVNIKEINRINSVFQDLYPSAMTSMGAEAIITEFQEKENQAVYNNCDGIVPAFLNRRSVDQFFLSNSKADASIGGIMPSSVPSGSNVGSGGSMARFAIVNDVLYTVGSYRMNVFDIYNSGSPVSLSAIEIGWGIETVFPYKNNLFIGAQNGMHIFNVSEPASPQYVSTFAHVNSCDPVVVNDSLAFVTLRSGNACQGFSNELDIIDIKNLNNPVLLTTYSMISPYGLGLDGSSLFVCEGTNGLKIFNASDIYNLNNHLVKFYTDIHAYDVIPFNKNLIMIGDDGLYQFDYSDLENIKLLSQISVASSAQRHE